MSVSLCSVLAKPKVEAVEAVEAVGTVAIAAIYLVCSVSLKS